MQPFRELFVGFIGHDVIEYFKKLDQKSSDKLIAKIEVFKILNPEVAEDVNNATKLFKGVSTISLKLSRECNQNVLSIALKIIRNQNVQNVLSFPLKIIANPNVERACSFAMKMIKAALQRGESALPDSSSISAAASSSTSSAAASSSSSSSSSTPAPAASSTLANTIPSSEVYDLFDLPNVLLNEIAGFIDPAAYFAKYSAKELGLSGKEAIELACRAGTNLRQIDLSNCDFTDDDLKKLIFNCPALTHLNVSHCPGMTDGLFRMVTEDLTNLTNLNVSECKIDIVLLIVVKNRMNRVEIEI